MDILKRLGDVVDYLEARAADGEAIGNDELARIALMPAAQLARLFAYIAGLSMHEYVRRRRLTLAAAALLDGDARVIDVALRFGYESPDAFTRAFAQLHGVSPTGARRSGASLSVYPRLTFHIKIKGADRVNYRLIEKLAFRIMGFKMTTNAQENESEQIIPEFWGQTTAGARYQQLIELATEPLGIMGVCSDVMMGGDFDYYIAVEALPGTDTTGWDVLDVPASNWAVFESVGPMPHAIQALWKDVMTEWLPSSGYKHAGTPDMEVYSHGDNNATDYKSWIWIPVERAQE